jgi:hypothetical protein
MFTAFQKIIRLSVCVCRWLTTSFCRRPAWTDLGRIFIFHFQLKMEKGTFSETSSALDPDTINSISVTPTNMNSWTAISKICSYFYFISSHFLPCYRLRKNTEDERTIKQQRPVIKARTSPPYKLQVHFTKHVDSNPWLASNTLPATQWCASAGTFEMGRDRPTLQPFPWHSRSNSDTLRTDVYWVFLGVKQLQRAIDHLPPLRSRLRIVGGTPPPPSVPAQTCHGTTFTLHVIKRGLSFLCLSIHWVIITSYLFCCRHCTII